MSLRGFARLSARMVGISRPQQTFHPVRSITVHRTFCVPAPAPPKSDPVSSSTASKASTGETVQKPTGEATKKQTIDETNGVGFRDIPSTSLGFNLPDINSTTLGAEDPMSKDPLKWRKFLWKYAGALLLFMVGYKSLHWYVDGLEKEGKKRREEVEENKDIVKQLQTQKGGGSPGAPVGGMSTVQMGMMGTGSGMVESEEHIMSRARQMQDERLPELRVFDTVKDEAPGSVSELDELYVYRIELQAKLRDLGPGEEADDVQKELDALAGDIEELEAKQKR